MTTLRALIIEDSEITARLYRRGLPDEVFHKIFARDGKEGFDLYQSEKPEIMLLDIGLPSMSGFSILKKIRKDLGDKETAIIMATAQVETKDIMECAQYGIQGYLLKPFNLSEIAEKILDYFSTLNPERAEEAKLVLKKCQKIRKEEEVSP